MSVLPAHKNVHNMHGWCFHRLEERAIFPGTTDRCEIPCGC